MSGRKMVTSSVVNFFYKNILELFDYIFTISDDDLKRFQALKLLNPKIFKVGDTRYDQVYIRSREVQGVKLIPEQLSKRRIFIAGSSWRYDEEHILPAFVKVKERLGDIVMIIVPHEPTDENVKRIESKLDGKARSIRFSRIKNYSDENVIIVDTVGLLLTLYQYADVAYIGGSFKYGVHNVLEAAVYGIPIIYGPKIQNSQEAKKLVHLGAGFIIHDAKELAELLLKLFSDENLRHDAGRKAFEFVKMNLGATDKIINILVSNSSLF
jgi:3-deoxy-D-manno-octulosonic-acid transferase